MRSPGQEGITAGSIIQIAPSFAEINPALAGCLATVEECRSWGVFVDLVAPGLERRDPARRIPLRVEWRDVLPTGGRLPGAPIPDDPTDDDGHNEGPAVLP